MISGTCCFFLTVTWSPLINHPFPCCLQSLVITIQFSIFIALFFSDFYLWLRCCDICPVPDLFHLKQCPPVQFILSQAPRFLSYIWIFSFLYMYHISLFFCKLMDGGYFSVLVLKTVVHESVSLTCWFIPASGWNVCKYLSHLVVQRCVCWFSVWATWPLLKWSVNVSKNYKLKTIFPLGLLEFAFYIWS